MDPSHVNRRTRAPSIVKEAPVLARDVTAPRNVPKWQKNHAKCPEIRHIRNSMLSFAGGAESPFGGTASAGGEQVVKDDAE